jgi:hypothetical protein
MSESTSLGISLPRSLVKRIDEERGDIPRSRFVLRIVEDAFELLDAKAVGQKK